MIAAKLLNRADLLIAMHASKADALRKLAPHRQVINVGVDFDFPNETPAAATSASNPARCVRQRQQRQRAERFFTLRLAADPIRAAGCAVADNRLRGRGRRNGSAGCADS